jgi:hypothetical protein
MKPMKQYSPLHRNVDLHIKYYSRCNYIHDGFHGMGAHGAPALGLSQPPTDLQAVTDAAGETVVVIVWLVQS